MLQNLRWNKLFWLIAASLSFIAALIGVFEPSIYSKVVSKGLIPGTFSEDLISITASIILSLLTVFTGKKDAKKQIVILGIIPFTFWISVLSCQPSLSLQ